jgi:Arc/MetJ-type ribon-helix-helix transcriptional regulator
MRRTTVTLPDELLEAVERAARRGQTSVSEVIRTMLAAQLGMIAGGERSLPFANLGRSGQRDVARNMETLLAEGWTPDRDR